MSVRISGLAPQRFFHLYGLSAHELREYGALRCVVDAKPGFPDRVELRDVEPGETVLLLNFEHQPADNPFRAAHAIYVREGAQRAYDRVDVVPDALRVRPISLRGFDGDDMLVAAELVDGEAVASAAEQLLRDPRIAYLHAHYAKPGCYAARIDRARRERPNEPDPSALA